MAASKVQGLAEANAFMGAIPVAARHEFADMAGKIGRDVLAAQKRDVAKRTGKLEAGLSLALLTEQLRVKVGLLGIKRGRSSLFYGILVETGRKAQTVLVTRRLKRKVRGNGRNGTKRPVSYEGKPYPMQVKALAARPFIHKDRPEIRAEQRLADFWSQVVGRAESAA